MNWSDVKSTIGTVAPWIAGTIGSPVAGVATKALCDALGLTGAAATPDNALAALSGASPAQLAALHAADLKHAELMQQMGYDNLAKLAASGDSYWQKNHHAFESTFVVLMIVAIYVLRYF